MSANERQWKVPIETMIITATSAAIGICGTQSEHHDQEEQEGAGQQGRQPPAPAGGDVDDRLADHGAAGHAAEQAGDDVRQALPGAFAVLVEGVSVMSSTIARSSGTPADRPRPASPRPAR